MASSSVRKLFLNHMRPYRWVYILLFGLVIGSEIIHMIAPLYYKTFFDVLAGSSDVPDAYRVLTDCLLAVLGLDVLRWAISSTADWLSVPIAVRVRAQMEQTAFGYILDHSYQFFSNHFTGSLTRKVKRLSDAFDTVSENMLHTFIPTTTVIVATVIILWQRNVWIGVLLLGWVVLYVFASYRYSVWKVRYNEIAASAESATSAVIADAFTNSTTIRLFSAAEYEQSLFRQSMGTWGKATVKSWLLGNASETVQWILMIFLEVGVMYVGLIYWQQGLFTIGDFALLQSYIISVFIRVWDLGRTIRRTFEAMANAKETVELLAIPHEVQDGKRAGKMVVKKGVIRFDDVLFRYNKNRTVLDHLELTIGAKEKIAFVGPSGAGKSTITKLLLRFHDIQGGKILIDGQDISKVTQDSLRNAIALVPQEPILFHRTLMDNIRYGRRDASDEEVIDAAMKAHCHEFISQLPEGYNTFVGERGVKLSGGERQRVAIARAILKDAPILILDEATSSLDSESEALIQDALAELMKNKTTIVIAHRLSTILKMDRIVVIDHGKVVDSGPHTKLMKKMGIYKTLWEIQAGGFKG